MNNADLMMKKDALIEIMNTTAENDIDSANPFNVDPSKKGLYENIKQDGVA
ncbi:hypothetical protein KC866_01815 [Patescibacteria group bacterium]|nr:hypothetical protein [Patescibacteria group bacterium]